MVISFYINNSILCTKSDDHRLEKILVNSITAKIQEISYVDRRTYLDRRTHVDAWPVSTCLGEQYLGVCDS